VNTDFHKTHHSLDLGEATTFPLIVYSMPGHGTSTQMSFFSKIGTLTTLEAHNFVCRPPIEVTFEVKLLRAFQWYVARHLYIRKFGRFQTFSDWELNWQFDS
jgi:hypothetical protein